MRICPFCALTTAGDGELCAHHAATDKDWAVGNRAMCDFLHRRVVPPPTFEDEGDDALVLAGVTAHAETATAA